MSTQNFKNLLNTQLNEAKESQDQKPRQKEDTKKQPAPAFNFQKCLAFMEKTGRQQFNPGFKIHEEDHKIIFKLLVYFFRDQYYSRKLEVNLNKGILLTGPVGCGKTTLMTLMSWFIPKEQRFPVKSTREITYEFINEGFKVINRYSHGSTKMLKGTMQPATKCFDDLGVESNIKYYGNNTNVIAEILLSRYDLYIKRGMITHATTNCSSSELENIYGNRVRSRLREMFTLVYYEKQASDKRA